VTLEGGPARIAPEGAGQRARPRRNAEEAAFRASVEERLRSLEAEVGEVKVRLNGLLFFIASTVIAQGLLRFLA
jgi:hypothetical protein